MRRCLYLFCSFLLFASFAKAQTTTITLQVTDAGSQSWNNGVWTVTLVTPPGVSPYGPPFFQAGTTTPVPNQSQNGSLSSSGSASMTLTQNSVIAPANSQWKFAVCSQATATNNCFTQFVTVTTATTLTLTPPVLTVNPGPFALAYSDSEISNAGIGSIYYSLTTGSLRVCNSPAPCTWSNSGGGGSGEGYGVATGTAQAQVVTTIPSFPSLVAGQTNITFLPVASNTAANPTLTPNGLTTANITFANGSPINIGDLNSGYWAIVVWDGAEYVLQNPYSESASSTSPTSNAANPQAQVLTVNPAISAYYDGFLQLFFPGAANTGGGPTIAISGLAATTITKCGGTALVANDLLPTVKARILYYSSTSTFELMNPQAQGCGNPVATVDLTAQGVSIGSTLLYPVPTGAQGFYRISCYAVVTRAATSTSTLPNCNLAGWTDPDTSTVEPALNIGANNSANTVGTTGVTSVGGDALVIYAKGGTNINYSTTGYATSGATSMQYAVHFRVEFMGP